MPYRSMKNQLRARGGRVSNRSLCSQICLLAYMEQKRLDGTAFLYVVRIWKIRSRVTP